MRNISRELQSIAKENHTLLEIIEKDYAISYLIAAISQTAGLGDRIALKGGTALRKLYYPGYRFSEDVDYSTMRLGPLVDSDNEIRIAIKRMTDLLHQNGPFNIQLEPLVLPEPHPGKQSAYVIRIQFPYHRQPLCRLKVELTSDEPVLLPVIDRRVIHGFDEPLEAVAGVYDIREIVAEKLRTLLQIKQKYAKRGWIGSRVCRDYYDLWSIFQKEAFSGTEMIELLTRKCTARLVSFSGPEDFLSGELLETVRAQWRQLLLPFVPEAPLAERVLSEIQPMLKGLWNMG